MSHNTDFVDDDLTGRGIGADGMIDPIAARKAAEANHGRMVQQRERIEDQVANTAQELELLRQKQEDLESEKRSLEAVRRLQEAYTREKQEMVATLHRSQTILEKEEVRASQLLELYTATRRDFSALQEHIGAIQEGSWEDEQFAEELVKAQDQLKAAKLSYDKSIARLEALGWNPEGSAPRDGDGSEEEELVGQGFGHWAMVGLAFSLPLTILLSLGALLVYVAITQWLVN